MYLLLIAFLENGPSVLGWDWMMNLNNAEWTAPILPILNSDGKSLRICAL